jgi:DNA (cytosine-5)-methyltransferase 1
LTFTYVSLFSGVGGFEQALNKLGGKCVMASEIDKYANLAYETLYGHKTIGDITKVAAESVPDHDLLVGGFPCQAFSVAGKRLGFEDTRGTLFFEIARIAKVKRPKAMLLENVKGLVSHDKGRTLDTIVQTLCDIGYTVDFEVLNSKFFGVPQNRERIFIIAIRDDLIKPEPWKIEGTNVVAKGKRRITKLDGVKTFNFDWPPQTEVTTRLRDILEDNVDERYYLSEEKTAKLVAQLRDREIEILRNRKPDDVNAIYSPDLITKNQNGTRVKPADDVMCALTVKDRHGVVEPQMIGHIDLKGHDAIKRVYSTEGVSPTLTTMGGGHREPKIAVEYNRKTGIGKELNVAHTVNHSDWRGLNRNQTQNAVLENVPPLYRIRKLTPRECFRLQGFPDSEFDKLVAAGISNSQLYKMAGNAVTVNVIDAVGRRLLRFL